MTDELGARNSEVKRLRALLRDRRARASEHAFVLEGPRVIEGALERGAVLEAIYLGDGSMRAFAPLVQRAVATGARVAGLKEGVLEKVGTTQTPQPVLAVAATLDTQLESVPTGGVVVVAVDVNDPGNLGTIIRSAEAAGVTAVVVTGNSVDLHNPKVVRSSAGALFGMTVVERSDAAATLDELGRLGRRRFGTVARDGRVLDAVDLTQPCAIVVGNEARGLTDDLDTRIDERVTIPIEDPAESLNVAMAATIVCFEAARQRRARAGAQP